MKLLFVTNLPGSQNRVHGMKWRSRMKLLFVSKLDRFARAVTPITKYVVAARALGHEVAVFGERSSELPGLPYSLDVKRFDFAVFVIYQPSDFPDLPYLATLLDGMPRERRVIIDCIGRFNETIRVEHDFNHLEKLDGHQGWEWIEGFQAVSDRILQPTLTPLRDDVRPFLFHGYDPSAVARSYASPQEAARAWARPSNGERPYGLVYVGNNWQRWKQVRAILEAVEPLQDRIGRTCLAGWNWDKRPDWAVEHGLLGVDVDEVLLKRLRVETREPIGFDGVVEFTGKGRFTPVFHRPLFSKLGLVTNRTFETFCADTLPLLMLPKDQIEAIYGSQALPLAPDGDVAGRVADMLERPESYWDAVLETRAQLAERHAYTRRLEELVGLLES
jgi:hypothetical protein